VSREIEPTDKRLLDAAFDKLDEKTKARIKRLRARAEREAEEKPHAKRLRNRKFPIDGL